MEEVDWLKLMLTTELELRPPSTTRSEQKTLRGNTVKLYDDDDKIIAYAEMRKVGSHVEISTVLVDPKYRGKGYGRQLIKQALQQMDGEKILCITKNPSMAKVLQNLDFSISKWLGFHTFFAICYNTIKRFFSMLVRLDVKRIWYQAKGIHRYDMFVINQKL